MCHTFFVKCEQLAVLCLFNLFGVDVLFSFYVVARLENKNPSINQPLFKHGKSSVKLKNRFKKCLITVSHDCCVGMRYVRDSIFIFCLKFPIESASLISWGRLFHRRAPL